MKFDRIRLWGWRAIELAAMAVLLCVLLHIILGDSGGALITAVAGNAVRFAQDVPAGTLVGLGLLALVYLFAKTDRRGF